ncbi:MAG: hypothetical protein KDE31_04105 [Caldilineaceae bacterium]|nr:hypothetical protein [Caldilineaceae bacterium]MCB0183419.1 hypothetical protein [Caldilineaceae bacterium]
MLHCGQQISTAAERILYLTAGEAFLDGYTGTAYHAHYILGAIGLFGKGVKKAI